MSDSLVGFLIGSIGMFAMCSTVYLLNTKWPLKKKATPDHRRRKEA